MLSTVPSYSEFARRTAGEWAFIVTLTVDGTVYTMSDRALSKDLPFPVLDLLRGDTTVSEAVDIYDRTWAAPEATISINNSPFFRSSESSDEGMLLRPSDKFGDIEGCALTISLWLGPVGGWNLMIFNGTVSETPDITAESITVVATAEVAEINTRIPQTIITRDDYPNAPEESVGRAIPRPYGVFSEEQFLNHGGLVPCERVSENRWQICADSNTIKSIDAVWVYSEGLGMWVKLYDTSEYNASVYYGYVQLDYFRPKAYAYIYPDIIYPDDDYGLQVASSINDGRGLYVTPNGYQTYYPIVTVSSTKLFYGSTANTSQILLVWSKTYEKDEDTALKGTNIGWVVPQDVGVSDEDKVAFEYQFILDSSYVAKVYAGGTDRMIKFSCAYDVTDSTPHWCGRDINVDVTRTTDWIREYLDENVMTYKWDEKIKLHFGDGNVSESAYPNPIAMLFGYRINETLATGTETGRLYEARLRVPFRVRLGPVRAQPAPGVKIRNRFLDVEKQDIRMAVEVSGIRYSSSIIGSGRKNYNNYSTSDTNISAPFIIEDILRDVGVPNIDTSSFDEADKHLPVLSSTSPYVFSTHVLVAHDSVVKDDQDSRPTAKDMIVDILRQTPYAMTVNALGRPRMLDMTGDPQMTVPSPATEIPLADIDLNTFNIGRTRIDLVKNKIIVEYMRRPHDGQLSFYDIKEDTDSQDEYDIREEHLRCDYLGGSGSPTVDYLTAYYYRNWLTDKANLGGYNGYFLSRPKCMVEFFSPGMKWMHLELGDYIVFESELDKHFKLFGASWKSWPPRMFMIYKIVKTVSGVRMSAIEPLAPES